MSGSSGRRWSGFLEELKAFQKAYRQESGKLAPPKPQLAGARAEGAPIENAEFKI